MTPTTEAPDLVERVARAVCSAHGNDPDDFLKALGFCRWVMYQPHARAAIAAMQPALKGQTHDPA